jgi:hypothetical protein
MTKVTWIPRDPTDPHVNIVHGIKFPANVPVELDPKNRAHGYNQLDRKTIVDPVTGREMYEFKEQWVSLIEILKGNPSFQVEGEPLAVVRKPGRPRIPRTSEDYRSHAQAWITASEDPDEMIERWEDEAPLREKCEVGDDDVSYLRPLFDSRLRQLGGGPEKNPMVMVLAE